MPELATTSPTMSRRTRSLFLTAAVTKGWAVLKGDVKAAFLQGLETETERELYARPVEEEAIALGGDKYSTVQTAKACYGLANAPAAQWHVSVADTMAKAGFEQLISEPCAWRLMEDRQDGTRTLIGLACTHVDDFLFAGDSGSAKWRQTIDFVLSHGARGTWTVLCTAEYR